MKRYLLSTVSYSAMALAVMINQKILDRASPEFQQYRSQAQKALSRMVFGGKWHQPVFRRSHFIKPDNWNEAPLVQS